MNIALKKWLVAGGWLMASLAQGAGIKAAGIDHVGVSVPALKQAEAFLSSTFGCQAVTRIGPFTMAPRADSVKLAMVRCGAGAHIALFDYKNATGSAAMPGSEDLSASHIAFCTDDARAGVAYLTSQGITVRGEPISMSEGDTAGETWVRFSRRGARRWRCWVIRPARPMKRPPPSNCGIRAGLPTDGAPDQMPAAPCRLMPDCVLAGCSPLRVSAPSLPMA